MTGVQTCALPISQFIEHFKKADGGPSGVAKAGVGSGGVLPKSAEPLNLLSEATRRIDAKQFAGAEAILNQMLTKEPGNPDVCQLLAKLHLQRGDLQVALGEYRYLAGAALRAQDYEKADQLITDFLAVEPQSVAMLELYGELYGEKGDAANAAIQYGKAIELLLQHPEPGMPTLHEELFEKVIALAPESPTVQRLTALMHGSAVEEPPAIAPSETPIPLLAATLPSPVETNTFSTDNAVPDDQLWTLPSKHTPLEDRQSSIVVPEPAANPWESSQPTELEPVTPGDGSLWENVEPDQLWGTLPEEAGPTVFQQPPLSMSEQFQVYVKAGQQTEAEEWLSRLVTEQPDHAEARELFGSLLEAKGDTAGAALQYSRALELILADPDRDKDMAQPSGLFAKVKELAPASPLLVKWASIFSPKPQAPVPIAEPKASAQPAKEVIDPETHYMLGMAYKNMGLLDEAKEEFSLSMKSQDFFLDSCLMLGVCSKEQGDSQSASEQLEALLKNPKCQGAKAQAIRYELGLLYEAQQQWSLAAAIYETIPTFHDVPQRLELARAHRAIATPTSAFRYSN